MFFSIDGSGSGLDIQQIFSRSNISLDGLIELALNLTATPQPSSSSQLILVAVLVPVLLAVAAAVVTILVIILVVFVSRYVTLCANVPRATVPHFLHATLIIHYFSVSDKY